MEKLPSLPDIPEQDQTPLVKNLLTLVEQFAIHIQQQNEEIALLKDEVNILKGEKKRPVFKDRKLVKKQTLKGLQRTRPKSAPVLATSTCQQA